eukprot:9259277-Karenia_brevis.AAC.1
MQTYVASCVRARYKTPSLIHCDGHGNGKGSGDGNGDGNGDGDVDAVATGDKTCVHGVSWASG